jgi:protein-tyrosine phosphatase
VTALQVSAFGGVDLHSHLVPGVDDGARSLEDVLEGVGRLVARGVRHIVTTPHVDGSLTLAPAALDARLSKVDDAFALAATAVLQARPELGFRRGHEIMLDHPEPDLSDRRLRLDGGDQVLVEWPRLQIPPETPAALRRLTAQGVQVLIAHPERYHGFDPSLSLLDAWKAEGARLQVNLGAVTGRYGTEARERALKMLERGLVDCLASDFHGRPHLKTEWGEARALFKAADADEAWQLLTSVNPRRILAGEPPLMPPPVRLTPTPWARIRRVFGR